MIYLEVNKMSDKLDRLQQAYEYCLRQAIVANFQNEFEIEKAWDDNAIQLLREIQSLKGVENT